VQFSPDLRDRVADGTITVSYRLWSRPKVKVGGVYRSGPVSIEIDEIELLPFSSITDEDLALSGEPDVETLRRRAAHAGPIHEDTLLYRVEFHVVRQPDSTSN
jgi:ASCH domain